MTDNPRPIKVLLTVDVTKFAEAMEALALAAEAAYFPMFRLAAEINRVHRRWAYFTGCETPARSRMHAAYDRRRRARARRRRK